MPQTITIPHIKNFYLSAALAFVASCIYDLSLSSRLQQGEKADTNISSAMKNETTDAHHVWSNAIKN